MPDPLALKRYPVTFEKGLLQSMEDSAIPNGFAPRIENWVPTPAGGLRARGGWRDNGSGHPASSKVYAIAFHGGWSRLVFVNWTAGAGGTFTFWSITNGTPADVAAALATTITGVAGNLPVLAAMGQNTLAFAGPELAKMYGISPAGVQSDSGTAKVPQNSYGFVYHHDAFYAGGGTDRDGVSRPSRLSWTDPGDGALGDWPANNWIDVGKPGGDAIRSLAVHHDDLIIGKSASLWLLQGTPEDSLDLHRLDAGSALAGRSICSTPLGAVIASGDSVNLFDGSEVQSLGRPIEAQYAPLTWADVAYFDNKVFIMDRGATLVWVFDFETGAWTTESLTALNRLMSYGYNGSVYLVGGPTSSALSGSGLIYRQTTAPRSYLPDYNGTAYTLRTPEMWLGEPVRRATVRYLDLQLRQRQTGGAGLTFTPTVDGTAKTAKTVAAQAGAGSFRTRLDFSTGGLTGYGFQFAVTTSPTSAQAVFDIESAVMLYELEGAQA